MSPKTGRIRVIGAGLIACCSALAAGITLQAGHAQAARQITAQRPVIRGPAGRADSRDDRAEVIVIRSSLGACEARLERQPRRVPTLAIVGASFTAGRGSPQAPPAWAGGA